MLLQRWRMHQRNERQNKWGQSVGFARKARDSERDGCLSQGLGHVSENMWWDLILWSWSWWLSRSYTAGVWLIISTEGCWRVRARLNSVLMCFSDVALWRTLPLKLAPYLWSSSSLVLNVAQSCYGTLAGSFKPSCVVCIASRKYVIGLRLLASSHVTCRLWTGFILRTSER